MCVGGGGGYGLTGEYPISSFKHYMPFKRKKTVSQKKFGHRKKDGFDLITGINKSFILLCISFNIRLKLKSLIWHAGSTNEIPE